MASFREINENTPGKLQNRGQELLTCLRWGQHSKNPVDTSLPKCPFPRGGTAAAQEGNG